MTEYIIREICEKGGFAYYHKSGNIGIKLLGSNLLNDDELLEYVSDSLIHEHIHKILDELFNVTISRLFDGLEHFFRNHGLHEKHITVCNFYNVHIIHHITYQSFIKKYGFNKFLYTIGVSQEDVFYANIICKNKKYQENK